MILKKLMFCFETSAEKSSWAKTYSMENCLNTSLFHLLEWCLLYQEYYRAKLSSLTFLVIFIYGLFHFSQQVFFH